MKIKQIISIILLFNISCDGVEKLNNSTKVIVENESFSDSVIIEPDSKEKLKLDQKNNFLEEIILPFWLKSKGFKSIHLIVDISNKDSVRVFNLKNSTNFDKPDPYSELKIFKYQPFRSYDTRNLIDTIENYVVTVFEPNFDKDFSLLGFWEMREDSIGLIALPRKPMPGYGVSSIDTLCKVHEEILIIGESSYGDEYDAWGVIWAAKYNKQSNEIDYIFSKEFESGGDDTLTIGTMIKYEIDLINKELIINSFKYKSIYQKGMIKEDLITTEKIKI